jgi:hypothetical protein
MRGEMRDSELEPRVLVSCGLCGRLLAVAPTVPRLPLGTVSESRTESAVCAGCRKREWRLFGTPAPRDRARRAAEARRF